MKEIMILVLLIVPLVFLHKYLKEHHQEKLNKFHNFFFGIKG